MLRSFSFCVIMKKTREREGISVKRVICLLLSGMLLFSATACHQGLDPLDGEEAAPKTHSQTEGESVLKGFENVKVGDLVPFGSLDGNEERITWKVLAVDSQKALMIASEGIDCQLYNTQAIETSWEECSLREWLNGTFLAQAFANDEAARILNTNTEPSVKDKLFLLSISEAETYFFADEDRVCRPNARAKQNGVYTDESGNCLWWLRDNGSSEVKAALVNESGVIDRGGDGVYCEGNAVRPAMWISLDPSLRLDDVEGGVSIPSSTTKKPPVTTKKPIVLHSDPVFPTDEPLSRPARKENIVNILVIGNSCAYYFMDELEGMASAAGLQVNVYNAYYSLSSGNQVDAHWANLTIYKNDSDKNTYKFFKTAKGDRQQLGKSITLQGAISYTDWDVIIMNESVRPRKCDTYAAMYKNTVEDAKRIYDYLKSEHPNAALFWYQGFSYEIGWTASNDETEYMTTLERQAENHKNIQTASKLICQQNEIGLVPVGDAWQLARENPVFGQHLTERWLGGKHLEDHYHDGESGGQYLNACVFFEIIFQKSCVGNAFFPQAGGELEHALTPEKVAQLQKIAHQAVASVYGNAFAK